MEWRELLSKVYSAPPIPLEPYWLSRTMVERNDISGFLGAPGLTDGVRWPSAPGDRYCGRWRDIVMTNAILTSLG